MLEQRISPDLPDWIRDHLKRYLETDGEDGYLWDATIGGGEGRVPTLILTTTGRKSGEPLTLPLIFCETEGGYAVIASKGGAEAHPAWYLNLQANPDVLVQIKDRKFKARARTAEEPERSEIWRKMAAIFAPYDKYQRMTTRKIPVVVLEPV